MGRLECYRNADGSFSWRLLSGNHRTLAAAPGGFATLGETAAAAQRFRERAATASVELSSERGDEWQWQMRHDADVIATGNHSYGRRVECLAAAERAKRAAAGARIEGRGGLLRQAGPDLR